MTIKSSGDLIAGYNTDIADNTTGSISELDVRQSLIDTISSVPCMTLYSRTTSGAIELDLNKQIDVVTLSGNVSGMTTTNRSATLSKAVKVVFYAGAADRQLAFSSSWKWAGLKPTGIPSGRYAAMSVMNFGSSESEILAAYEILGTGNGI